MRGHAFGSSRTMDSGNPLINRKGQVFTEVLLMTIFLAGFFALLLSFAGETHGRLEKNRWSQKGHTR